jgi:hypothetical protein
MSDFPSRKLLTSTAAALLCLISVPTHAADEPDPAAPKGAAVTVLKAVKA